MGVQPSAESHFRVGGMDVVRKKQKTPLELSLAGFFSDSNRIYTINTFAFLLKLIKFVYQIVAFVNPHMIATVMHL